ncbi:unnamed protein product [Spirodela intermedia]|uniref:Pre-mRNA polyadenylation factor Fip1 domain-containing protein n=1 Tax=Spirodela intermedia TaxID=51605 RepID=A0A7I8IKU1_SPIIN|nr:unnamed protein product [Spirodela intermedia]CAA6657617.1 unnamed protein product [Spirodela intermedia]
MADEDEFGDLYVDVLRPASGPPQSLPSSSNDARLGSSKPAALDPNFLFEGDDDEDEEDKGVFHGASDSYVGPTSRTSPRGPEPSIVVESRKGRDEDWMLGDGRVPEEQPFSLDEEEEEVESTVLEASRVKVEEEKDVGIHEVLLATAPGKKASRTMEIDHRVDDVDQEPVIPGLSAVSPAPSAFRGMDDSDEKISRSEDLESDSDDDLQIVLNDDNVGRPFGGDEEEDLVIVTDEDHHHHHAVEEQEYGDELTQAPLDGERNEVLESSKGNGGVGGIGLRIGYNSHGFHGQHHSQFKYIRPGAAGIPGGSTGSTGATSGQARPSPAMGPMTARTRGMQKGPHSARAYGSGLDFTLPSHKTIFDVDIDGFEEKPWRHPGVDISDFFNFGLDEESWRDYRKHLEQLRLEATMQSKIRVYESGRSEQDYDPDLPPELAAATGAQDYSDSTHHGKPDGGCIDLIGPGIGAVRSHAQLPTGRAIQVEGGCGDRLPSIDTRRPRMRDSDAIIEIVLQDSVDDSITSNGTSNQQPYERQGKDFGASHESEEHDRDADSEYLEHTLPVFSDRKGEMIDGKETFTGSVENSAQKGTAFCPLLQMCHVSIPTTQNHIVLFMMLTVVVHGHGTQVSIHERYSHVSDDGSNAAIATQSDNLQVDDDLKDKSGASKGDEGVLKLSPSTEGTAGEIILEGEGDGEQNERLALDDGGDIEDEERASDFRDSDETQKDNGSQNAIKKQKFTAHDDQPTVQGGGVDPRVTQSGSRKGKLLSSKDYPKRRDSAEEEVQHGRTRQTGDPKRHHDEEKRSSQRRDDHGRDVGHVDRHHNASKGRQDSSQSHPPVESRPAHHGRRSEGLEKAKERDASVGVRQRRDDDTYGRRGKDGDTKRDHGEEIGGSRHRDKVRIGEKKGKDADLHSRKHVDDGDRKVIIEILQGRMRNNGGERRIRRSIPSMDTGIGTMALLVREKDDASDPRKREEQVRDNSTRHRDDNWRQGEKEDRQRFKQPHEDTQKHRERDDRSGRLVEDKNSSGGGRRYPDRNADYVDKHKRAEHGAREEMHSHENQLSSKEKNSRQQRSSSNIDHHKSADGRKMNRESQKESSRKNREAEGGELKVGTGKRKRGDRGGLQSEKNRPPGNHTEENLAASDEDDPQNVKRGRSKLERWTSHKERDFNSNSLQSLPSSSKAGEAEVNGSEAAPLEQVGKSDDGGAGGGAEVKGTEATQPSDSTGKENDRHLDTVAKLKKRSERFKVPLPGEKDGVGAAKKSEGEVPLTQSETPVDSDIKQERPARKRRWSSS